MTLAALPASGEIVVRDGQPLPTSVIKILEGALHAIGSRGVRRLSMSDISEASGVSRATLYRYFGTKDAVLAAVSEFTSLSFETGVREMAEQATDPVERFRAVMRFFARFTAERSLNFYFETEPKFYVDFFRSHFERHKAALREALGLTFDHLDALRGRAIDRDACVEALIRMQISTLIIPANSHWNAVWDRSPDELQRWIDEVSSPAPASKEA